MKTNLFWFMDIGPRQTQEDCIMIADATIQIEKGNGHTEIESESFIAAVCDGLGGHEAGEIASRFFCDRMTGVDPDISMAAFAGELRQMQYISCSLIPESCGTTIAGIKKSGRRMLVFNAGDIRVYHYSRTGKSESLEIVSHDHSYVQDLVDHNLIPAEDAESHPYKNVDTFGMGPVFQYNETERDYYFNIIDAAGNDSILICSDGVSDSLGNCNIEKAMAEGKNSGAAIAEMLYKNGLKDNASFIHICFS